MSSQGLFEQVKQKWWEVWTIKHQSLVWQLHSLIFSIENTSCNRCQLPIKESSHEHQRSCLNPSLFNCSSYALEMLHEHLISVSDVTPSGRDKETVKNKQQNGNCNPRGVCSNAWQSLTAVGGLPPSGARGLGPRYLLFIILKINK